jgi:AmmeMemoRadiSam system protein A
MTTQDEALVLARYARACVRAAVGGPSAVPPCGQAFERIGGAFVSLHHADGTLQGCIGTLEPHRQLADDVAENARAAALHDPRGRSIALEDVDALEVEVSVLGPLEPVEAFDEARAVAALRPGTDGVMLAWGGRRATFIPQMWAHFADGWTFLAELKQKAGLPADFWAEDVALWRYTAVAAVDPPPAR